MKVDAHAKVVTACLAGLAIALIVVGMVSDTVVRHLVQIAPAVAALTFVRWRPAIGAYAALPIFICWLLIVGLIWLFLVGLSRIANGHYTIAEIVSTFVMAGCCARGAIRAVPMGRPAPVAARFVAFAGFAAFQIAAMWISFTPSIANR
jgi:hypothetical protein